MLSYEPELEQLRPILGDGAANVLIARERREVFSIYPELRLASWGGVMLLATAAGIVLKNNLDRIGPLALAVLEGRFKEGDEILADVEDGEEALVFRHDTASEGPAGIDDALVTAGT